MSPRSLFAALAVAFLGVMGRAAHGQTPQAAASSPTNAAVTPKSSSTSAQIALELLQSDPGVVWIDDAHTHPGFIPERLLNKIPISDLPLYEATRAWLGASLRPPSASSQNCLIESFSPALGPTSPSASSFNKVFAQGNLALIGHVASFEKGYFNYPRHVATVVRIVVDEILRDRDDYVKEGEEIAFPILGGTIAIGDEQFCNIDPARRSLRVQEGEKLLVIGLPLLVRAQHFVMAAIAFPISADGAVEDVGYTNVRLEGMFTLQGLRAMVAKESHEP